MFIRPFDDHLLKNDWDTTFLAGRVSRQSQRWGGGGGWSVAKFEILV